MGDDFDFSNFGADSSSDSFSFDDDSANSVDSNSSTYEDDIAAKEKKKKLIAKLIIGAAILLLIIILSIWGGVMRKNSEQNTDNEKQEQTTQTSSAQTSSNVVNSDGWNTVNYMDMEISEQLEGTFTITNIECRAKVIDNSNMKLELSARATGAISGLVGVYTLNIPWRVADKLEIGNTLQVYYYIGTIDGNKVVLDIDYRAN